MKKIDNYPENYTVGCMMGTAYQILLGKLAIALNEAGLDITPSEYLVLRTLYANDGIRQCDIVEALGKDKGAVCRTVSALERKGVLHTETVSHKCLRVYLTEYAKEIEPRIMAVASQRHAALKECISEDEFQVFVIVLSKIINNQ